MYDKRFSLIIIIKRLILACKYHVTTGNAFLSLFKLFYKCIPITKQPPTEVGGFTISTGSRRKASPQSHFCRPQLPFGYPQGIKMNLSY